MIHALAQLCFHVLGQDTLLLHCLSPARNMNDSKLSDQHIPMKSWSSSCRFIQGKLRKAMAIMSYSSQTLTFYHSRNNYVHRFFSYSPLILLSTSVWFEFFYSIYHFLELMWNHALYEWWDMSIRVFTTRIPLPLCCRLYWVKMRNR